MTKIVEAGSGKHLMVLTDLITVKLGKEETHGAFLLLEVLVPPGGGVPLHRHPPSETFYILHGTFSFALGPDEAPLSTSTLSTGDIVHVSGRLPHSYTNIGAEPGKMLVTLTPAENAEEFFEEIGILLHDPSARPAPAPFPEGIADLLKRHRVEIL